MRFGRYELRERLGEGAAGAVYRAFDEALGRDVALKLLHEVDVVKAKRFEREAEVTARLDHPGVLKVHSFGVEGGIPFLVYELIESARTLDEALVGASREVRVEWIRQAAVAIGYAHAQGLVHRDLKPENLLVDPGGRLRVADFGVATGENMERLTRTGAWVGTPVYMAPEQLFCEREKFGPHTDVWALGAMLFEALSDELPFDADNPMELLSAARSPVRSLRSLAPDLPRDLEQVCQRALELDPQKRYPTGEALAAAITSYLEGRSQPNSSRARVVLVSLAASLVLALAWLGWRGVAPETGASTPRALSTSLTRATPEVTTQATPDPRARALQSAAFTTALALESKQERFDALSAWRTANPSHPKAKRALRLLDNLRWNHPILDVEPFSEVGVVGGTLFGERNVLIYLRPDDKTVKPPLLIWRGAEGRIPLETKQVRGSCGLPGSGGFALWIEGEGLVISRDGWTLESPIPIPGLGSPHRVFLSAWATSEGWWIAIAGAQYQGLLRVSGSEVTQRVPLIGWPSGGVLRGLCVTPGPKIVLFGAEIDEGEAPKGLALRFDARTGRLEDTLARQGDLNTICSACFNPRDPREIVVGTLLGHVLFLGGASKRSLVSTKVTRPGFGGSAHRSIVQFVSFWRDGSRLITMGSAPAVGGVVRTWRVSDGAELREVPLGSSYRSGTIFGERVLFVSDDRARVYRID
ncbi:MAG: serine/threonine protein kinase [Planctomycetes bacterium]|nr:serine/threonine protein kinase [Planctomycetota bacterium]